ncbi:MAG: dihydrolipoyl dehydrogenase [Deltaproteobacteria bacterium]|nr:dihydrolipoyl dehydrogenase [Deltaproteobacteria bacterium]
MPEGESFDVVVIGAGPGGYVAAIRAAQLGFRVACVDKDASLGGTCLNVGCIPSKALLHSSHLYWEMAHDLAEHGIKVEGVSLDLPALMSRKAKVVTHLTRGVAGLFKKNGVTQVVGTARLEGADRVAIVDGPDAGKTLTAKHVVLASGSVPIELPGLPFDHRRIVDSTDAIALDRVPKRLLVVGAGAIGLELGSVWSRLGSEVEVIELTPGLTPGMDVEMAKLLHRSLRRQGLKFHFESRVESFRESGERLALQIAGKDGKTSEIEGDVVLVAVGRKAYTGGLGLAEVGIELDARGRIPVDERFATKVAGVYAIGDAIAGPMLAHKAEEEGIACVELLAGKAGHVSYDAIPAVVYTHPEFAGVGKTEEATTAAGIDVRIGRFPFTANARARTTGETDGAVKIIAEAKTDLVLGVHVVAAGASDLIAEAAVAIEMGASAEDLARSVHAHPTLPEALKEAALAVDGRSIHI